jgi:hypothetical protein
VTEKQTILNAQMVQPSQPQVLAQQLPQVPRFQVSNIVAENQTILRRLSSASVFCA